LNRAEKRQSLLDEVFQEHEAIKGAGVVLEPIDLESGNLTLTVVPWIGGRIISIRHRPSGYEWLEGRFESGRYEEYSGSELRSSGCTEEYKVVRYLFKFTHTKQNFIQFLNPTLVWPDDQAQSFNMISGNMRDF